MKEGQSCISFFVAYPTIQVATSGTSPDMKHKVAPAKSMHGLMIDLKRYRATLG